MSEMKHVWIINHYTTIPSRDLRAGRHYHLAKHLHAFGWQASLIAASTQHPAGRQTLKRFRSRKLEYEGRMPILWLWANRYLNNGLARILNMASFSIMLLIPGMLRGLPRPDVIVGSSVHPFAAWAACRLARRKGIPFVFESRDLWPETLIALGRLQPRSPLAVAMRLIERGLIKNSAFVMSPLPGVGEYMASIGFRDKRFLWISNGIDLSNEGDPRDVAEPETPLGSKTEGESPFLFMYLGSMGNANALKAVLDAFESYVSGGGGFDVRLRLIGAGPKKAELARYAATLGSAPFIAFEPAVPQSRVLELAHASDCLIANMHDLEIYKYGISLNKLFDYLLAARPILFGSSAANNPVREANAGICVPADDVVRLAEAMSEIRDMSPTDRIRLGANGRKHVVEHYTYSRLAERLAESLDQLA